MRPIIVLLLWLGIGAVTSFAQPFRIVTWQVDHLPPARAGATNSHADEQRFADTATILNGADADVIILYGVQDVEAARKIAGLLKVRKYSAIHHTAFRHGQRGPVVGQPFAILSRRDRIASKTIEWTHTGRIDNMPGGFGFAAYRLGQTAVAVYVTSLPGSLTNGVSGNDGKYFARKRDYAADFLAHHTSWLAATFTNPVVATYITGDFQLGSKGPFNDGCAKILEAAGFRALAPGTATDKSTTSITNNAPLDRVQDPVFTRNVEFIASRQINRPAPEHPLVVCDLTFKAPTTTAKAVIPALGPRSPGAKPQPPKPEPAPAPIMLTESPSKLALASTITPASKLSAPISKSNNAAAVSVASVPRFTSSVDRRWIWWTVSGAIGLAILGMVGWISAARRQIPIPSAPRLVAAPLHLELQPTPPSAMLAGGELSVVGEPSTATGQTDRIPWDNSAVRTDSGNIPTRMTPQLKQLMREVVVAWLARQRTHLLESHERGTEQVLELHSRVEKIKAQFQERIRSQQHRIVELDAALRSKEKIILDLVRAHRPEAGN